MPDTSSGIDVWNGGGFTCGFRVKTSGGRETPLSSSKFIGFDAKWSYDDLIGYGFKEGDNCWVSCDIDAGETNHESAGNFLLVKDAGVTLDYFVTGGVWNPSWDGPSPPKPKEGPPAVDITNAAMVLGRVRVKSNGKETQQSRMLKQWDSAGWTFDELTSFGFQEGDSCWVSVDIEAGTTNHESGDNFTLKKGAAPVEYELRGGTLTPSWTLK
jgi:hypothetical protein